MSNDDEVKKELLRLGVKLWKPPYYENGVSNSEQLKRLAHELSVSSSSPREPPEAILTSLEAFQTRALGKLAAKKKSCETEDRLETLEIKILGAQLDVKSMHLPESWADQREAKSRSIKFRQVNPALKISEVLQAITDALPISSARLVHKGKALVVDQNDDDARLAHALVKAGAKASGTTVVLCLVSLQKGDEKRVLTPQLSPEQSLIYSIRNAASKIQNRAMLDVTDGAGNLVPMTNAERLAFVTALGLHRLGRRHMEHQEFASALVFLLEADFEWNRPLVAASAWRDKVDNYGLLQLDIAWSHLQLESIEHLPNVVERLEVAEAVLRKQVHSNFVTLALVQSELGNPVPALAAVFVRLFLLQGIAYHYSRDNKKSKERLDWAWALAKSLRAVSSEDVVWSLRGAVGVSEFQAISALRRTNGNPDQAAELLQRDDTDAVRAARRRQEQNKLGLCANGIDYPNIDLISQLKSVLDLPTVAAESEEAVRDQVDTGYMVAAALLRLSNNDLGKAIDMYQELNRDNASILKRMAEMDQNLQDRGVARRTNRKRSHHDVAVDEVALATLVSMGVNARDAKRALSQTENNIDMALLWLTDQKEEAAAANAEDRTPSNVEPLQPPDSARPGAFTGDMHTRPTEEDEANELLERELGQVLQEQDMDKDYLGNNLHAEWEYIEKYRAT